MRDSALIPALLIGAALGASGLYLARPKPSPPVTSPRAVELAESLAIARTEARRNLDGWQAALAVAPPDTVLRWATRYVRRNVVDTVWTVDTLPPVELVRALVVSDSSCRVELDSLAGELVQARYDVDECQAELAKRPTACNSWSAFGVGAVAGFAAGMTACAAIP